MSVNLLAQLGLTVLETFEPHVVTATVVSASSDVALLRLHEGNTEAVLPATEWFPTRRWSVGDTYQLLRLDS